MNKKKIGVNFANFEKFYIKEPKKPVEYKKISQFERKKYFKYIKILSKRFNKVHNLNFNVNFWNKIFLYFLLIHISQCYRLFRSLGNLKKFDIIYCSKIKNFIIPELQNDHRDLFHRSFVGQEKIFYSLVLDHKKLSHKKKLINISFKKKENKSINFKKKKFIFERFFLRTINFLYKILVAPKILVTKCYWTDYNKDLIKFKFKGKISTNDFSIPFFKNDQIWVKKRDELAFQEKNFDEFDKFFFKTLSYSIPKSFLENFSKRLNFTKKFLNQKKYLKLKYILNESLDENNLLLFAVGQLKNIKSVYIEHNLIHYPFLGSHLNLILSNVDKYLSNGWEIGGEKKIKKWGSLSYVFDFKKSNHRANKKVGFICGIPNSRYPFTSSFWGECGHDNSVKLIKNYEAFFNNLNRDIFKKIMIKKHPLTNEKIASSYNKMDLVFNNKKTFNSKFFPNNSFFGKILPSLSLAILPYYSTPFLQCLVYNIPTIVFLNKDAYFTEKKHNNFFKELINSGIIHKNPISAAKLANSIVNDPASWWNTAKVQKARKNFLKKNLNIHNNLISDLKHHLKI